VTESQRSITLRFLAEPADVNFGGKVHGGAVMKWIDQAGYACAVGWSKHYCVTAYVGGIRFLQPIYIGNVVELTAKIVHTGRTSMHVGIDIHAGDPRSTSYTRTTRCIMVFVAVDDNGHPVKVPTWNTETKEDKLLEEQAKRHMELSNEIREQMAQLEV